MTCPRSRSKSVELGTDPRSAVSPNLMTLASTQGFGLCTCTGCVPVLQMDMSESTTWVLFTC